MPDPERREVAVQRARIKRTMQRFLTELSHDIARQAGPKLDKLRADVHKAAKGDDDDETDSTTPLDETSAAAAADALDDELDWSSFETLPDEIFDPLARTYKGSRAQAVIQVGELRDGLTDSEARSAVNFDVVNDAAVEWAEGRAAEMIGMKRVDGRLVDNPDARWRIDDTTREAIKSLTRDALMQGWSAEQFTNQIIDDSAFSYNRANMIARTEARFANSNGTLDAWRSDGRVEKKAWSTAEDDKVEEVCQGNAEAGDIPLDDAFPSGDAAPPAHPNCRCVIVGTTYANDEDES
ncbi:phage minor head protein [Burkholderia sp. LMG 21824]|uniref:phage minor head protein n=1 Tax=Burkholderia sp. LMG 21824 TaxID=3158172 RepID=UPI003C3066A9